MKTQMLVVRLVLSLSLKNPVELNIKQTAKRGWLL